MWNRAKDRIIAEQHREITRLREEILRWRSDRDKTNQELGGLRTQNVDLHKDNVRLASHLELVIVQLAAANDERVALLRARGVAVPDAPQVDVARPGETPVPPSPQVWGTPLAEEQEAASTIAAVEAGSNMSLFEDPGDGAAAVLGRKHNEFGEVEYGR